MYNSILHLQGLEKTELFKLAKLKLIQEGNVEYMPLGSGKKLYFFDSLTVIEKGFEIIKTVDSKHGKLSHDEFKI